MRVIERPVGLLADVDAIERRLRQEYPAVCDQLRQVPVDERQQQRGDVVTVGVGIGEDDDAAVAQPCEVEVLAEPAAERGHEVRQLLVLEHLRERHPFGVHHLAAQRKDRLLAAVAPLLRRSACRIALDDEQLAVLAAGVGAVTELAGKIEAARRRGFTRDLRLRRAARLARPRREDDARDDRFRDGAIRGSASAPAPDAPPNRSRRSARDYSSDPWSAPGTAAPR